MVIKKLAKDNGDVGRRGRLSRPNPSPSPRPAKSRSYPSDVVDVLSLKIPKKPRTKSKRSSLKSKSIDKEEEHHHSSKRLKQSIQDENKVSECLCCHQSQSLSEFQIPDPIQEDLIDDSSIEKEEHHSRSKRLVKESIEEEAEENISDSECLCCQPLSEIEIPEAIPEDLDAFAYHVMNIARTFPDESAAIDDFFKDIPDIDLFCPHCNKT
ncbi:hypothetical protein M9H77_11052 [Catharanthus roseus]|uniref:Uncharacterized protein n=1 Tax=Catharanthus roseus TaxID=4058 RepID=A0ACC0BDQ1_CATRO|nr:hypothetical protein M9H77_11052 [Catharanthus roseus]